MAEARGLNFACIYTVADPMQNYAVIYSRVLSGYTTTRHTFEFCECVDVSRVATATVLYVQCVWCIRCSFPKLLWPFVYASAAYRLQKKHIMVIDYSVCGHLVQQRHNAFAIDFLVVIEMSRLVLWNLITVIQLKCVVQIVMACYRWHSLIM